MKKELTILVLFLVFFNILKGQSDSINKYDSNGFKTGRWEYIRTDNGKIWKIEFYKLGKKNGISTYYDVNGRLLNEVSYVNDSLDGPSKYFSPTGQTEVSEFKNGKHEGITRLYNYKDQLTEELEYHNNMLNGYHRIFSESGRIIMEGWYVNGKETGTKRSYKDNDERELIVETDYVDDKQIETRYYKKGKLVNTIKHDPSETQKQVK